MAGPYFTKIVRAANFSTRSKTLQDHRYFFKGLVKLMQRVKIAHSFLQSVLNWGLKGLFIVYWEYGAGVLRYGTRTFLMLPSTGHKDFLCSYGMGHELFFWEKNLSNYIL